MELLRIATREVVRLRPLQDVWTEGVSKLARLDSFNFVPQAGCLCRQAERLPCELQKRESTMSRATPSNAILRPLAAIVIFAAGWILLAGASPAHAQDLTWAQKMFDKLSHDFGVVARGADVSYRFKVTNLYRDTVRISNVRSTCGCSAATPTKTTLASRESAYIEVTMDTRRFTRQKDSNLIVTFDAPLYAEVRIPVPRVHRLRPRALERMRDILFAVGAREDDDRDLRLHASGGRGVNRPPDRPCKTR
jgi:hypothetical protein